MTLRSLARSGLKIVFLSFLLTFVSIPFSEAGLRERAFETILPNGLKVILLEDHKAPLVTFQVWYRVGSRNEEWGKTGLSHMLEHMMFKGTEKVGPGSSLGSSRRTGEMITPSPPMITRPILRT